MKFTPAKLDGTPFAGVKCVFVEITPELASDWLKLNRKNRNLREAVVQGYTIDINNGAWMTTHQGIAFDADGNLIDGQHRLSAIVQARKTVLMLVSQGWPPAHAKRKTMDTVDRGINRTLADQLHLQHDVSRKSAGEVVKICNAITCAAFGQDRVRKATTDTLLAVFALYKAEIVWRLENPLTQRSLQNSTVSACLIMARALWPDKTADALNRLETGENLTRDNPILPLRNWLMSASSNREENTIIRQTTLHHLDLFVHGKTASQCVVTSPLAYQRIVKLHKVRVEKICAIYGKELPEFMRATEKKSNVEAGPLSAEALEVGKTLSTVFTSTDLQARTDANVGLWVMLWMRKGWIESSGVNAYRKTDSFGKV